MKRQLKPRLFVFEIVIDVLLFAVLLCVGVQFLANTHRYTRDASILQNAVSVCSNVASLYQSGDGTLDSVLSVYTNEIHINEQILIYLDENYTSCAREAGIYYLLIETTSVAPDKIEIRFFEAEGDAVYTLSACHYDGTTRKAIQEGNE